MAAEIWQPVSNITTAIYSIMIRKKPPMWGYFGAELSIYTKPVG